MTLGGAPDPVEFVDIITRIHRETSANGAFGYAQPTVIGKIKRTNSWQTSWGKAFACHLKDAFDYDRDTNGPWRELRLVYEELVAHVVPRLLDVLQMGGRSITPALIHGDLWERNIGADKATGKTVIFDPGCFYGHNEMEFGTWRCTWATHFNLKDRSYLSLYQKEMPPSEPADEWDDRNRLYSIYAYLVASAGHFGSSFRLIAQNEMIFLCEKYGAEKYNTTRGKYNANLVKSLSEDESSGIAI
ncbi:Protein kinase-like domain protein [Akanthomyces lecanii RCEF 1005]|uniref:protein-ribulosamine 3-kinase n=1 Tax=Akanthomyces lecanii RCEF 1005 TaxID=1081108 RepID=A0A168K6C9_CORDF|nr:Protein kinase-like domain protein [Akanthomyces lecanii RCEF 1005]